MREILVTLICFTQLHMPFKLDIKEINQWYTLLAFPLHCYSDAQDEQFDRLAIV